MHHNIKTYEKWRYISACMRGWMGPRASPDMVANRNITAVVASNQTLIKPVQSQ